MSETLTIDDLLQSSPLFKLAFELSCDMTLEELVSEVEKVSYKAFGFEGIQVHRFKHNGYWSIGLRNPADWQEPRLECRGATMYEAFRQFYAWAIHKGYITAHN